MVTAATRASAMMGTSSLAPRASALRASAGRFFLCLCASGRPRASPSAQGRLWHDMNLLGCRAFVQWVQVGWAASLRRRARRSVVEKASQRSGCLIVLCRLASLVLLSGSEFCVLHSCTDTGSWYAGFGLGIAAFRWALDPRVRTRRAEFSRDAPAS